MARRNTTRRAMFPNAPMRSRLSCLVLPVVAVTLVAALLTGADPPNPSLARVAAVLDSSQSAVLWGVVVADAHTGEVLFERNATRPLLPASNQKILTAAVALDRLGGAFRYRTPLLFSGSTERGPDGTTLRGTFAVVGTGDPSFGSSEVNAPDPFAAWAEALRARGVVRMEGTLVGDDDRFDDYPYAEGWDVDYLTTQADRYLGVPISALAYRDNLVTLKLGSGPTDVTATPAGVLTVVRRDRITDRTRGFGTGLRRLPGTGVVEIAGTVRARGEDLELPVDDPTRLALVALRQALGAAGIDTTALRGADVDALAERPDYDGFDTLAVHASPPLADLVAVMGTQSNNFYAEQIYRTLSPGGDSRGSRLVVRQFLHEQGDTTGVTLFDGSGLSRKNLVTPRALSTTLLRMYRHPEVDAFLRALPYPGLRGGTLEYRLEGVPVRAKTGTLTHTRALSGYLRTASGRDLVFVLLANHFTVRDAQVVSVMDRLVRALAAG